MRALALEAVLGAPLLTADRMCALYLLFTLPRAMTATAITARSPVEVEKFGEHRAAGEGIAVGVLSPITRLRVQLFERAINRRGMTTTSGIRAVHSPPLPVEEYGLASSHRCWWNVSWRHEEPSEASITRVEPGCLQPKAPVQPSQVPQL